MKIEWDFTVQLPKKTCYGTTGYARLGRVILGGEDAEPGAIFRFHICADTPCKAQWTLSKYGAGKEAPLHVILAPAATDEPAVAGEHAAAAVYGEPVRAPEPSAEPLEPLEPPDDPPEPPVAPVDEEEATIVHPVALAPAVAPPPAAPAAHVPPLVLSCELSSPPPPKPDAPVAAPLRQYPPAAYAAADCAVAKPAVPCVGPAQAQAAVIATLIAFARRLRQPRTTVGYSAFLLFALHEKYRCRPLIWEGESIIDLVAEYAPWAKALCVNPCACDAVACAIPARSCGRSVWYPISEKHPLGETRHWIGGSRIHMDLGRGEGPLQEFYNRLGLALLGTVTDDDCGVDTMCLMLQLPQTAEKRQELRIDLSDYLLERLESPWMQDLMVATCELSHKEVKQARLLHSACAGVANDAPLAPINLVSPGAEGPAVAGHDPSGDVGHASGGVNVEMQRALFPEGRCDAETEAFEGPSAAGPSVGQPAVAGDVGPTDGRSAVAGSIEAAVAVVPAPSREVVHKALAWATGTKDKAVALALEDHLPEWAIKEQVQKYNDAQLVGLPATKKQKGPVKVTIKNKANHEQIGKAFGEHLALHQMLPPQAGAGATPEEPAVAGSRSSGYWKLPGATWDSFMSQLQWPKHLASKRTYQRKLVLRWHMKSLVVHGAPTSKGGRGNHEAIAVNTRKRAAGLNGVHLIKAPLIRKRLYEWFLSIRYSIDWHALNGRARSCGHRKAMGRFPRSMLKAKVTQFQIEYAEESLLRGVQATLFEPRSRWFREWEREYGLSMRQPNRKYKCSKALLARRLEAFWITVFRIRALCLAIHGYDPDMENFDQTPYHANESGSQDARSLAVTGEKVPVIEGHGATRVRWTANLTTFSDAERIERGERPYCEFMFKHDIKAEVSSLELRVREHIRSRGYGPWVTVATSHSGSYSQDDVLNFLDRHLPQGGPQSRARYWRIMFADDFAAHKVDAVRRLCWQRGYVLILQPGGATPFTQTCDTDLNQHVRRDYIAGETLEFIEHFQRGEAIPTLKPETMVDIMVAVLSNPEVHLRASRGYKKTAVAVHLDGREDQEIQREAGDFWRELGMRQKVDADIAAVRAEAQASRLTWTYGEVLNLMVPYPASKEEDRLIELSHDAGCDEDAEARWQDALGEDEDVGEDAGETGSETDSSDEADAGANGEAAAVDVGGCDAAVAGGGAVAAAAFASPQSRTELPEIAAGVANDFDECQFQLSRLTSVHGELQAHGFLQEAHGIQLSIDKQRRRVRALCREDKNVALALIDRSQRAAEQEQLQVRRVEEAHKMDLTAKRVKASVDAAEQELKRKRAALRELEDALETKHAMKTFTPELLGQGQKRAGGARGHKARSDVLDRLAFLGVGLSPGQRNDWAWFKTAWDTKMVNEHDQEWGSTFAGWIQQVLDEMTQEGGSNAFSSFVHRETLRCFSDQPALRIPCAG